MTIALRAPVSANGVDGDDEDRVIGASVEHSIHVDRALSDLLTALEPNHPLAFPVFEARSAVLELSLLREHWVTYCGERARPDADETGLGLDREFPAPARVRAWPLYNTARRRTERLNAHLVRLQAELADFTGHDITGRQRPAA
ncbi:hypothetical protein [Streptomyces sp. MP131-18]|uniref:hypothetical protein n=1 Tax=Streptomyces sp. MP131-18 TaxID=1857892 RepID=UPI00117C6BE1|nr:hypothetical protein [Streptomyces sp. MP131-18]